MQAQTQMQAHAQKQQHQQKKKPPAAPTPSRSLPPPSYSQNAPSAVRAHEYHHQHHQHLENNDVRNNNNNHSSHRSGDGDSLGNGYGNRSQSHSSRHSPQLPPLAAATTPDPDCTLSPLINTISNTSNTSSNSSNSTTTSNTINTINSSGSGNGNSSNRNNGSSRHHHHHHLAHRPHDGGPASGGNGTTLPSLSSITADMPFHRLPPPRWTAYSNATANATATATATANASVPTSTTSISTSNSTSYRPSPMFTPDSPAVTPMDTDGASRAGSTSSPDRLYEGTPTPSSVTLDDPDVRLAAEALGDLRADFVSSPSALPPMFPPAPPYGARSRQSSRPRSPKPEPLLALLTTSHPLVASTIGGASSVYGGAKNYSPRFKSGAEYVEGYLTPLANTVNSVGRATGVEGGVRWFLGGRSRRRATGPTSDPAQEGSGAAKRRRTGPGGEAIDSPEMSAYDDSIAFALPRTPRRLSSASTLDSLPAYDDMRSPAYTEVAAPAHPSKPRMKQQQQQQRWPTRLITSTSGLSIAMSAESLRSLKYCLRWLRWANDHLNHVILMLKHALEEYEKAPEKAHPDDGERDGDASSNGGDDDDDDSGREGMEVDQDSGSGSGRERETKAPRQSRTEIAARINSLKHDVLKTLQDVVNNVSKYAGGALPENARDLVRRHLTSLPKRFLLATQSDSADKKNGGPPGEREPALEEGAQKMLVLAKEGLDIVAQVSAVLDATIVSAEQWCDSLGRKRQSDEDDEDEKEFDGREPQDVKMG